jgi:hypothetical protein
MVYLRKDEVGMIRGLVLFSLVALVTACGVSLQKPDSTAKKVLKEGWTDALVATEKQNCVTANPTGVGNVEKFCVCYSDNSSQQLTYNEYQNVTVGSREETILNNIINSCKN